MKPLRRVKPALAGWRADLGNQPPAGLSGTISPGLRGTISPGLWGTISPGLWGDCTGLSGDIAGHVQEEGE